VARRALFVAACGLAITMLAGCSSGDPLAAQFQNGGNSNYISGEGVYKEYTPAERGKTIDFTGVTDAGTTVSDKNYLGSVYVVNFWYAGCPPCRLEAPKLEKLAVTYGQKGVKFLGVNTYDQADTSLAFARTFGITYPSIIDANNVAVQFAFAGSVAPNAVPTTLVMDRAGRVAARWSGLMSDPSILSSMIDRVIAEGK
jgi:peroxiredoxin